MTLTKAHPSVIILMSDYGHDPTETALPWQAFTQAGFEVHFATEHGGHAPSCDKRMMEGWTGTLLGANQATLSAYKTMIASSTFQSPLSWTSPSFSLSAYTLVLLPGGHDKGVQQIIDNSTIHKHLSTYWPLCSKASSKHAIAAVCHGVLVLARTTIKDGDAKSVLHDATTTALAGFMEQSIYYVTKPVLGDYYKTYGAGSASVEEEVRAVLDAPEKQWRGSTALSGFVVEDEKMNYASARYPGDVPAFCDKVVEMVRSLDVEQ